MNLVSAIRPWSTSALSSSTSSRFAISPSSSARLCTCLGHALIRRSDDPRSSPIAKTSRSVQEKHPDYAAAEIVTKFAVGSGRRSMCSDVRVPRRVVAADVFQGLWAAPIALLMAWSVAAAQESPNPAGSSGTTLPEIRVIATTPVAPPRVPARALATAPAPAAPTAAETAPKAVPGAVELDKIPSNVQTVGAPAFDGTKAPDLLQSLDRALPGVSLSSQTGNDFQLDLNYRGFTASPVIGTPQGLAVYQNGVRINEVFGDVVNWDLIPQKAISNLTLVPSNPVYGLNAIGGALSLEMKNGFTYQGVQGEVNGGSYGRIGTSVQAGGQNGNSSGYITADAIDDAGWRQDSPSRLRRVYADLGTRGDQTEFHVTFTGADNTFGAAAATPIQMLSQSWSSVYTIPQMTENRLAFLTGSGSWKPTDTLTFQANLYYRGFWQSHADGNGTDATACPPPSTLLCFPNLDGTVSPLMTTGGQTVSATGILGSSVLGEIDRTWTSTNSFGGSVQGASSEKIFGHDNNFVLGMSVDRGLVQFTTTSELGTINADQFRPSPAPVFTSISHRAMSRRCGWVPIRSI